MLVLVGGLALLGAGICLLVLELSSPGFRTLRDRRRWAEAEAQALPTAEPAPVSAPSASPPGAAERRRLRLPHPWRRSGQPTRRLHRWRFDPGKPRLGRPSWRRRPRTAGVSGGFPAGIGRFRRHHHVVGGRGSLAGYAAVLAVAVGSGFVIAQLLTR
jgi:hypothetical protein